MWLSACLCINAEYAYSGTRNNIINKKNMRLTFAYTSLLMAVLFCCQSASAYTRNAGLRLMLNNQFLKSTSNTLLPKAFNMVHEMIKPPNSTNRYNADA